MERSKAKRRTILELGGVVVVDYSSRFDSHFLEEHVCNWGVIHATFGCDLYLLRRDLIGDECSDLLAGDRSRHRSEACCEGSDFRATSASARQLFAFHVFAEGGLFVVRVKGCLFVCKHVCEAVDWLLHSSLEVNV